jgi:hypothetical protein
MICFFDKKTRRCRLRSRLARIGHGCIRAERYGGAPVWNRATSGHGPADSQWQVIIQPVKPRPIENFPEQEQQLGLAGHCSC